jgi:DNA-binding phage protein
MPLAALPPARHFVLCAPGIPRALRRAPPIREAIERWLDANPTIETITKVAKAFDMNLLVGFQKAG